MFQFFFCFAFILVSLNENIIKQNDMCTNTPEIYHVFFILYTFLSLISYLDFDVNYINNALN